MNKPACDLRAELSYVYRLCMWRRRLGLSPAIALLDLVADAMQGFDEYMNLTLDEAEEVDTKTDKKTSLGMYQGDCEEVCGLTS